ncbi:hypothetical protein [Microcoleus sp. FACHB-672]|nr:hypothetical protein [Microcoleus sp. FACHB-672]
MTLSDLATIGVIASVLLALFLVPAARQTEIFICVGYCPAVAK